MTKKLYQEDVYRKECESTVLGISGGGTTGDPYVLRLDETIFFPTGGGQPCDLGTIGDIPVTDVFEEGDEVFHKLLPLSEFPRSGGANGKVAVPAVPKSGERVRCSLDWARRFDHMQRHCGEHILSGIFFRETGGVNRGFHMGSGYMTIDIDVPGITKEQALQIEMLTNEVIWSDVPVTTRYFENRSDAEKLPLRKALAIDEAITIVCVGDEGNPADCVACCGTHPSTSGQVGLLKIYRLENYKGMTRVYFDAGRNALEDYRNKYHIITELNRKFSADDSDLQDKMKVQDEKNRELRQELYLMKNTFIAKAADEILNAQGAGAPKEDGADFTSSGLVIREFPYFNANDLLAIAKILTENPVKGRLTIMISTRENLLILVSDGNPDCNRIVKDNAPVWRGKGGGNQSSARAMFPSRDDLDCFVTYLRQAYQKK